ncbi:hypothetical protein RIF25_10540 [Thermosynechococcaceae cyanobacterium BACA0444]|uniref:Uncharacterized protein n=1 Tax=Pseudocalidococcus azoricus BACA0444 TaxID=2918990 RepID=A0AAE4FS32_9CYAN|nr:hypothetical protein [Pseudocalidococcus azoricus]MDS3861244.1 hypothetical protein [Pseudocalidococcus azoricus BACA0444]
MSDRPQNRNLKPRYTPGAKPDESWYPKPISVRVGQSVGNYVYSLPTAERLTWLRKVLKEAVDRELAAQNKE